MIAFIHGVLQLFSSPTSGIYICCPLYRHIFSRRVLGYSDRGWDVGGAQWETMLFTATRDQISFVVVGENMGDERSPHFVVLV